MTDKSPDPRFDARGCLTPAGMEALRHSPPGKAPIELASHVGSCLRCQERLLATESLREHGAAPSKRPQPLRTIVMILLVLLTAFLALLSIRWTLLG